jgi:hypothetical protein
VKDPSTLRLPAVDVDTDTPASFALRLMRARGRSGVIGRGFDGVWLYSAAALVIAIADDPDVRLANVPPTAGVSDFQDLFNFCIVTPRSFERIEEPFPGRSLDSGPSPMQWKTQPALFRSLAASPHDCYCRVDGKPVEGGRTGGDCPYGHDGAVRCV